MRTLALALVVLVAAPATAAADPFGELPYRSLSDAAGCVRPTGAAGGLSRMAEKGVQFMQAGTAGLHDTDGVTLGDAAIACPEAAITASGAGVVAVGEFGPGDPAFQLKAATRDPGGGWGKPQVLAGGELPPSTVIAVASERGDAAVAWTESQHVLSGPHRFRLARRAPGGAFTQPVTVFTTTGDDPVPAVRMAIAAGGELVATWTRRDPATKAYVLEAAIAPPGGALGPPQRIGQVRAATPPALAVAPDGSALIAYVAGTEVRVAERAPGGAFGAPVKVAMADDVVGVVPAAALGPDGAAAVAWESVLQQGVGLVTRARAGAFGPPVTVARNHTIPPAVAQQIADIIRSLGDLGDLAHSVVGGGPQVALAGDRALATWIRQRRPGGLVTRDVHVATLPLAGGHLDLQTLGGALRDVDSAAPVVLADGRAGVAWADDDPDGRHGRLHLALDGLPPPAPAAAPVVRIGRPRERVLSADDSLRVPISCSAACDVRVQQVGRSDTQAELSLGAAGTRTLRIAPAGAPIAHLRRGPIRFRVATGPPGGPATVRTVAFTLRRRPEPPAPHVLGLTAVRHGSVIIVSWHTDRRVEGVKFLVAGGPRRSTSDVPVASSTPLSPGRHWSIQLSPARHVRWVYVQYVGGRGPGKPTFTRVTG